MYHIPRPGCPEISRSSYLYFESAHVRVCIQKSLSLRLPTHHTDIPITRLPQAPSLNASASQASESRLKNQNRLKDASSSSPARAAGSRVFGRPAQPRVAAQAARVAAQVNSSSLPWNLSKAREKNDSAVEEQRGALDKMTGRGRCGCLPFFRNSRICCDSFFLSLLVLFWVTVNHARSMLTVG